MLSPSRWRWRLLASTSVSTPSLSFPISPFWRAALCSDNSWFHELQNVSVETMFTFEWSRQKPSGSFAFHLNSYKKVLARR